MEKYVKLEYPNYHNIVIEVLMINQSCQKRQHKDFTHFTVLVFTKTSCALNHDVLAQSYLASINLHHQCPTTTITT